jgi:beta-glucosidase
MKSQDPRFVPPSPAIERRVTALIEGMTLSEKVSLLGGKPGVGSTFGVARLGIPELRLADGPMGVHWWCDASTAYPAVIAAAASFDPELWYRFGQALGRDCRARGVHILLAPGVNIYRSALCGRNFEYAGEDPYLSSRFGVAYVAGVQDMGVSATIKHYACNFQEYERHHVSSDVDARTLREVYLPAFEAAVTEAGCGALMTAYNLVNGVHCSEHPELILDILRGEWGFQGVVMSDWISTYSAVGAANAGLGLEMPEAEWLNEAKLVPAIERGEVSVACIDDKVRCLLRLAACFGWLDHEQQDASIPLDDPATAEVALELARAGIVLLSNEGAVLPLSPERTRKLAVLGFGAHPALISGGGSAYAPPHRSVSVLEGLRTLVGERVEVQHARGPDASPDLATYATSVFECDAGAGLWGEYFDNNDLAGAPAASRLDPHIDFFWGKAKPAPEITVRQYSIRWRGAIRPTHSGKHVFYARCRNGHYRIRVGSQLIIDTWQRERNGMHPAELTLEAGQRYEVLIEWRKTRVSGNMKFGWRFDDGKVPGLDECVALARTADAALVCVGFDNVTESEGYDREFRMPETLERLVTAVAAVQPRTVVVLTAGGNVHMGGWIDRVAAVLHAWYPGQAGGQAIAEALFGRINPSGRLPATFERELADRSSFDSYHDDDGDLRVRLADGIFGGYRHFDRNAIEGNAIAPRFPFGFGLSYTRFEQRGLELARHELERGAPVELSLLVKNVGERAGAQVVQAYVRELEPSVPRPLKELAAFAKVRLEPGEERRVTLSIAPRALSYFDEALGAFTQRPGKFEVLVGPNAAEVPLRQTLVVR